MFRQKNIKYRHSNRTLKNKNVLNENPDTCVTLNKSEKKFKTQIQPKKNKHVCTMYVFLVNQKH